MPLCRHSRLAESLDGHPLYQFQVCGKVSCGFCNLPIMYNFDLEVLRSGYDPQVSPRGDTQWRLASRSQAAFNSPSLPYFCKPNSQSADTSSMLHNLTSVVIRISGGFGRSNFWYACCDTPKIAAMSLWVSFFAVLAVFRRFCIVSTIKHPQICAKQRNNPKVVFAY